MNKNWDDIRVFLAVARCGTVTEAADKLAINQSTVSRRVNAYEKQLKVRLFDRLTTGYVLTSEGEDLRKHAERMEEESLSIERNLVGKSVALSGPIRVTTSLALTKSLFMSIFCEFANKNPAIELQIDVSNNEYNLIQREADVALRITRNTPHDNLIGRELAAFELSAFGTKELINRYLKNRDLALPWIGEDNNIKVPDWLPSECENLSLVMRTNDVLVTFDAVRAGLGVGRMLTVLAQLEKGLMKFPGAPVLPKIPLWVLYHQDMRRVSRITKFIQFVSTRVSEKLAHVEH